MPPIVRDDDIYHEVSSVGLEDLDDEGWSRPLARKPSLDRYFGQRARDARLELWAQAPSGISQTLIAVRKSTLEHYDFIEKIAFARKRLSIAATDGQRSAEIVATVTME